MTNPISRRLHRLETEVQKTHPGHEPIFKLIDNPRDPENVKRLEEARQFLRDNPTGMMIRHLIVHPRTGSQIGRASREKNGTAG